MKREEETAVGWGEQLSVQEGPAWSREWLQKELRFDILNLD